MRLHAAVFGTENCAANPGPYYIKLKEHANRCDVLFSRNENSHDDQNQQPTTPSETGSFQTFFNGEWFLQRNDT